MECFTLHPSSFQVFAVLLYHIKIGGFSHVILREMEVSLTIT
jgi:hypothetical protein